MSENSSVKKRRIGKVVKYIVMWKSGKDGK